MHTFTTGETTTLSTNLNANFDEVAGRIGATRTITATTTLTDADKTVFVNATSGAVVVTLPLSADATHSIAVKKIDATANTVTVTRAGSDTIDGANTKVLSAQWESYFFAPDGATAWGVF